MAVSSGLKSVKRHNSALAHLFTTGIGREAGLVGSLVDNQLSQVYTEQEQIHGYPSCARVRRGSV